MKPSSVNYIPSYIDPDGYFLTLREKWYNMIQNDGFKELEYIKHNKYEPIPLLKQTYMRDEIAYSRALTNKKAIYFTLACRWNHIGDFSNFEVSQRRAKKIWKLHSEGQSVNKINKEVGKAYKLTQKKIQALIYKIKHRMLTTKEPSPPPAQHIDSSQKDILEIFAETQELYYSGENDSD